MAQIKPQALSLDYTIVNSETLCGQGNINSIKTGDGYWRTYIGTDATKLKCQLKNICIVIDIEMKISNVNMVQFTGYLNGKEQINQLKCLSSKERESGQVIKYFLKGQGKKIDELSVDLHNFNKKQVLISFLKFNGNIVQNRKNQRKSVNKKNNFEVFQQRTKQATQKRTKQSDKKPVYQKKEKLQHSKQQQGKQNQASSHKIDKNKAQLDLYIPDEYKDEQLIQPGQEEVQQDYRVIRIRQQHLERLNDVNQKWIENQKKLQASYGVKTEHKLSIKLNPKCFNGLKFCLANIYGEEKMKYVRIIKQLGGLVREEPSQGCIVATSYPKGNIVGMARLMNNTHIVKLSYIDQCSKKQTKLKVSKYQYYPEQFIM